MKVMFIRDEIWPDYVPFKDNNSYRAEFTVEMTETELADYESIREAYFNWQGIIRDRYLKEED